MNNTNKITPTSLSYTGGGVQPNFSAVGRKQQFSTVIPQNKMSRRRNEPCELVYAEPPARRSQSSVRRSQSPLKYNYTLDQEITDSRFHGAPRSVSRVQSGFRDDRKGALSTFSSAKPTFSSAKLIVNCPLSIVNCKLSTFSSAKLIVHYPLLILLCLFFSVNAFAEFGGGIGTEDDPYIISSITHLNTLADNVNGGSYHYEGVYFKVTEDITSTAVSKVIGGGGGSKYFSGIFDGNNKRIKLGINVTTEYSQYIGLFGYIKGATIKNVKVEGTLTSAKWYAGSIAGYATDDCVIENCSSSVTVTVSSSFAAGIVGNAYNTTITDCSNTGNISGTVNVGGISGNFYECTVSNCSNTGAVTGASANWLRGGIVGNATGGTDIMNCSNTGNVTGNKWLGGIVGSFSDGGLIDNCSNTGTISSSGYEDYSYAAGIVGSATGTSSVRVVVSNCSNEGSVSASKNEVGGIIGQASSYCTIDKCWNTANVTGQKNTGGIVGWMAAVDIRNCYNRGNTIQGTIYVGGIVGTINSASATVKNCYNTGMVKNTTTQEIGGIFGISNYNSHVENCYNGNTITSSATDYKGGIFGRIAPGNVDHCYYRTGCGVSTFGFYNSGDGTVTNTTSFTHTNTSNTTCTLGASEYGTTIMLEALNAWVDAQPGNDYLKWAPDNSLENLGMPIFYTCTPVPDPSLSVTQTNTGGRELQVSWTATDGVSYTLYYGVNDPNSGLENVYNAGTQTSPYNALRLTNGVEYHFAIKPTGSGDYCADNPLSSTVSATPVCNK